MSDTPSTIGPYRIRERLGTGGMGSVYLGQDTSLQRLVAVKVMNEGFDDESVRERFTREAHCAGRLRHRNIITVFGFGDDHGRPYLVMEYLPGETLGALISRKAPMSMPAKLAVMRDVCAGLGHAHRRGILHRDVKPANVMVDTDGTAKIVDFGIARRAESNLTRTGSVLGTLNYLSPEQLSGQALDARSDIFAVGALFYELITGTKAFPGGIDEGVLTKILYSEPAPVRTLCPEVLPEIEQCIARALAKTPEDRFPDLETMETEIAGIAGWWSAEDRRKPPSSELSSIIIQKRLDIEPQVTRAYTEKELKRLVSSHVVAARRAFTSRRFDTAIEEGERALALDASSGEAVEVLEQARGALRGVTPAGQDFATARRFSRWAVVGVPAAMGIALFTGVWTWTRETGETVAVPPPAAIALPQPSGFRTPSSAGAPTGLGGGPTRVGVNLGSGVPAGVGAGADDPTAGARDSQPMVGSPVGRGAPPPPPSVLASLNLDSVISGAQSRYDAGRRDLALGALQTALSLDAQNPTVLTLVHTWLARARQDSQTARLAADKLGTGATSTAEYRDARSRESEAARMESTRPDEALDLFWTAAASYNNASELARKLAAPSPTPGVSTPPVTAAPDSTASNTNVSGSPAAGPGRGATALPTTNTTAPPASPATPVIPPGARDALNRYAAAYAKQSVNDIRAVFPALPRDRQSALEKAFSGCRSHEVRFGRLDPSRETPDSIYILADVSYSCTPRVGAQPPTIQAQDLFQLQRKGNTWIIVGMQLM